MMTPGSGGPPQAPRYTTSSYPVPNYRGRTAAGRAASIAIRVAAQADRGAITALFEALHTHNSLLDSRFPLAEGWQDLLHAHFARARADPPALWLLAWVNEQPAGLLLLEAHHDSPLFRHRAWAELVALYVAPAHRCLGVAGALLEEARAWTASQGFDRLQLFVTVANESARRFYRHHGLQPVQEVWRLEVTPVLDVEPPTTHRAIQAICLVATAWSLATITGCICCTVRGDLIRILGTLMKRRDKFDYILVETTGMADPGPVAQTFFVDDEMQAKLKLDGIVTLVDAKHVWQHFDDSDEVREQIAFADVILLNKIDLASSGDLDRLEARISSPLASHLLLPREFNMDCRKAIVVTCSCALSLPPCDANGDTL